MSTKENPQFPRPYPVMTRPAIRPRPMQVLCLVYREQAPCLGYNSYHYGECALDHNNDSVKLWHQALNAKYHGQGRKYSGAKDFDQMLWRYDIRKMVVTDIPCVLFVDELLDAYSDAKVIITSRPLDKWLASMGRSFYEILSWKRWPILEFLDRKYVHYHIPLLKGALQVWTGTTWDDKAHLPRGFEAHYRHVRSVTKEQKRAVLEVAPQDGWKPLCDFLGKDISDVPFPHANEGDFSAKLHYPVFWFRLLIVTVTPLVKYVVPIVVAYWLWKHYLQR